MGAALEAVRIFITMFLQDFLGTVAPPLGALAFTTGIVHSRGALLGLRVGDNLGLLEGNDGLLFDFRAALSEGSSSRVLGLSLRETLGWLDGNLPVRWGLPIRFVTAGISIFWL
jgi:hypothetical protein